MSDSTITQLQNIVDGLARIAEGQIQDEKVNTACHLNEMDRKALSMPYPSEYAEGYKDAVSELKERHGIKGTFYELYEEDS